jgi:diadenosine tetraphosphatase ApaH/serine/threonine PP2A family protein phosphatase
LPIAAVVDGRIFCVHEGLSPAITWIEQINLINRKHEIEPPAIEDLTWSDPEEVPKFSPNPRGKEQIFGQIQTKWFLWNNRLLRSDSTTTRNASHGFVARSHQIANNGWQWMHNDKLVTVWSAPNYCYKMGNDACVMKVEQEKPVEFVKFEKDPGSHVKPEDVTIDYFA